MRSPRGRRLPMTPIDDYAVSGDDGPVRLGELFGDHPQLVLQTSRFHPEWDRPFRPTLVRRERRTTAPLPLPWLFDPTLVRVERHLTAPQPSGCPKSGSGGAAAAPVTTRARSRARVTRARRVDTAAS